jgi:phosphatidylinositol dimannoside acyltransferase
VSEALDRARGRIADLGFAAGWSLVKALPAPLARRSFKAAGDLAAARKGPGAQRLRANLRRVVGPELPEDELDALVRAGLRSYARYWLETFRLPKMDPREVVERTTVHTSGREHLDAALERGKGAVLALPHSGNWDVAGLWLVAHSGPFVTVAERLHPESLFERFVAHREGLGFEVLPLGRHDPSPMGTLARRLRENKVAALVADRDLSRHGVPVQFFGEPTRMPGGPAMLAATTGAALLPISLWFTDDGGWGQRIHPPLEVPEGRLRDQVPALTQAVADVLATGIAQHPADWHMLQPLWLADLPARPDRERGEPATAGQG